MICLWHWGIAIVRFHCYEKNMAYIGHHYPLNVKIVSLCLFTTMSSHKNQKEHTTKTKERQNNIFAVPTQWKNRKILNPVMNLLKHGDETTETWWWNYWNLATSFYGLQRWRRSMANNLGTTSDSRSVMRGLGGLLDRLDAQQHVVCPVCVPPGRGDCLCVFALCFPPQCRGGI